MPLREVALFSRDVESIVALLRFVDRVPQPGFMRRRTSALGVDVLRRLLAKMANQGRELMMTWMLKGMGRCMFRTNAGYFGMAGPRVKAGDSVAVVQGGKAPLVLRRKNGEASGTWELVGL